MKKLIFALMLLIMLLGCEYQKYLMEWKVPAGATNIKIHDDKWLQFDYESCTYLLYSYHDSTALTQMHCEGE